MTSYLSDVNLFFLPHLPHHILKHRRIYFRGSLKLTTWQLTTLCKTVQSDAVEHLSVFVSKSDDIGVITQSSPWVFNQQGLDEVDGQGGDPLESVLRVVYVDLRDVEECLLLVITQEGRLTRQHDIGQDPNTPVRERRRKGSYEAIDPDGYVWIHFVMHFNKTYWLSCVS